MRWIRLSVFLVLAGFLACLRAKPFQWEGTDLPARVTMGGVVMKGRSVFKPEALGNMLLAAAHKTNGPRGLSVLTIALWLAAFTLVLDAARTVAGFSMASVAAALILPLAAGDSAPSAWTFSAVFGAAFLDLFMRVRQRTAKPVFLLVLPVLGAAWPFFHRAGVLLAPAMALMLLLEIVRIRRIEGPVVEGGIFLAPEDPLLFKEEDLDMTSFLRVLGWETKLNQMVHARLGMTAAQLMNLTAARAVSAVNDLMDIPDLPDQAAVPDPGVVDGNIRARNRQVLDIHYKDALRPRVPKEEKAAPAAEVLSGPPPLWAPLTTLGLVIAAAVAPPAGLGAAMDLANSAAGWASLSLPSAVWVLSPRSAAPAMPYFWGILALFGGAAVAGYSKNRDRFSSVFFLGGLGFLALAAWDPTAAPLAALMLLPLAVLPLGALWREDTLVRTLTAAAVFIVLMTGLFMADWDNLPLAGALGLGALPAATPLSTGK